MKRVLGVLGAREWYGAHLPRDPGAMAWLDSVSRDGYGISRIELLGEGQLAIFEEPMSVVVSPSRLYASCPACDRPDSFLAVRRRYTGPVPRQVLAAFVPDGA